MITAQKGQRYSYDYTGATYYLEGLIGGIPYQQRQIARLQEDLDILRDEMHSTYHSPNLTAWDDGTYCRTSYYIPPDTVNLVKIHEIATATI